MRNNDWRDAELRRAAPYSAIEIVVSMFVLLLALLLNGCAGIRDLTKGTPPAPGATVNVSTAATVPECRVVVSLVDSAGTSAATGIDVQALLPGGGTRVCSTDAAGECVLTVPGPPPRVESWLVRRGKGAWLDYPGALRQLAGDPTWRARVSPTGGN